MFNGVTSMMRKLLKLVWIMGRFWKVPLSRKLMYVESFFRLMSAWALIRLVPYALWRGLLGKPGSSSDGKHASDENKAIAVEVASVHFVIHRVFGTRFTCLMLALSARGMLSLRGVPSELILGVHRKPTDTRDQKLGAHAWVTSCSVEVIGHEGNDTFLPVATYSTYHNEKPRDLALNKSR